MSTCGYPPLQWDDGMCARARARVCVSLAACMSSGPGHKLVMIVVATFLVASTTRIILFVHSSSRSLFGHHGGFGSNPFRLQFIFLPGLFLGHQHPSRQLDKPTYPLFWLQHGQFKYMLDKDCAIWWSDCDIHWYTTIARRSICLHRKVVTFGTLQMDTTTYLS